MNEDLSQEELTTEQVKDMNRNPNGKGGFGDNPQNRNDGGRIKNPMKEFQRNEFKAMSDEKKREYLNDIDKYKKWIMAEGNPDSDVNVDATITGPSIIRLDE